MKVSRVNHLGVIVSDIEEAAAGFRDLLGLPLEKTEVYEDVLDIAFLPCGDTQVELIQPREDAGDAADYLREQGPGIQHMAFEVDDLEAVIKEAGGQAVVFGVSSGAPLALEAASRGAAITRLALYEAPFIVDGSRPAIGDDFLARMNGALRSGRRGDAVRMFMKVVCVPAFFVMLMQLLPVWSRLTAIAHTLPYDFAITNPFQRGQPLPPGRWSAARIPTLVMDGGKSPDWMRNAMRALAGVLPNATYRTVAGQTHMVKPKALTPPLVEFFGTGASTSA